MSSTETHETRNLLHIMRRRRSCRGFLAKPVPEPLIRDILSLARHTPSWCNTQPWHITVTREKTTDAFREALMAHVRAQPAPMPDYAFPEKYPSPYLQRRQEAGLGLYAKVGIERSDREARNQQALENFRFFGAPHVLIISSPAELGPYAAIDCGGMVNAVLTAFEAYGLGAIAQAALAIHSPFLRDYFNLPNNQKIVCGISFGYADPDAPANQLRTSRLEIDQFATFV